MIHLKPVKTKLPPKVIKKYDDEEEEEETPAASKDATCESTS